MTQKTTTCGRRISNLGKYLEIFHLGEGESTVLLRTNREMLLTYSSNERGSVIDIRNRRRGKSCVLFLADQSAILISLCCGSLQIMMTWH